MTINLLIYILVLVSNLTIYISYSDNLFCYYIFLAQAIAGIFLFIKLLAAGKCARVKIMAGDGNRIFIILSDSCPMTSSLVKIRLSYYNMISDAKKHVWIKTNIISGNEIKIEYEFSSVCCGRYKFILDKIYIYDPLKIFKMRISRKSVISDTAVLYLLPEIMDIDVKLMPHDMEYADNSKVSQKSSNQLMAESIGIREYQPGDRPNTIHWKASAKVGELLVREFSSSKAGSDIALFICTSVCGSSSDESVNKDGDYVLKSFDSNMKAAASVSAALASREICHTDVYAGKLNTYYKVSCYEDYKEFIMAALDCDVSKQKASEQVSSFIYDLESGAVPLFKRIIIFTADCNADFIRTVIELCEKTHVSIVTQRLHGLTKMDRRWCDIFLLNDGNNQAEVLSSIYL